MVLTMFMAAGKVLPSTRKKVVTPTYDLLSRKMQEKPKTFRRFMPFKLLNLGRMVSNNGLYPVVPITQKPRLTTFFHASVF